MDIDISIGATEGFLVVSIGATEGFLVLSITDVNGGLTVGVMAELKLGVTVRSKL